MGLNLMQQTRRLGGGTMGRNAEPVDEVAAIREKVRVARLELVRRNSRWVEIPETRLVTRSRFLIDAETDEIFTLHRGVVFEPNSAVVGYVPEGAELHYFVDEAGAVIFLERQRGTWSEIIAKKARRAAGAK